MTAASRRVSTDASYRPRPGRRVGRSRSLAAHLLIACGVALAIVGVAPQEPNRTLILTGAALIVATVSMLALTPWGNQ